MAGLVITRFGQEERPGSFDGTLFRVVEGDAGDDRWQALAEVADDDTAGEYYREIFRAPDARPIDESARYVFMIRIDVAPDLDHDAFNDWYDHKHVPEVAPAGLRRGRRYASEIAGWPYIAVYDMDDRDTLQSEALAKVRGFYQFTPQITAIERTVLERADWARDRGSGRRR